MGLEVQTAIFYCVPLFNYTFLKLLPYFHLFFTWLVSICGCYHEYLNTLGPDVLLHARNQLNMAVSSENARTLQLGSLETTIAVLKSKRPRTLTLEQKQDILVASTRCKPEIPRNCWKTQNRSQRDTTNSG